MNNLITEVCEFCHYYMLSENTSDDEISYADFCGFDGSFGDGNCGKKKEDKC